MVDDSVFSYIVSQLITTLSINTEGNSASLEFPSSIYYELDFIRKLFHQKE
mgnify:CR=1 FL=1